MSSEPGRRLDRSPWWKRTWPAIIAALVALMLLAGVLYPWTASAYYVGRGGRRLAALDAQGTQASLVEDDLYRALAWDPGNAQAARLLAQLYRAQGDWPAAAGALANYVSLAPENPLGYWELAQACENLDETDLTSVPGTPCGRDEAGRQQALAHLWRSAGQAADSFIQAGAQMRSEERWDQAIEFYRRALIVAPGAAGAWFGLGEVFSAQGDGQAAMDAYARATAPGTDPGVAALAHSRRGEALANKERWDEARDELAQAVALVPTESSYHFDYGWYLYQAGDSIVMAQDELEQAAALSPDSPWPFLRLANIAFYQGDYARTLAHAEQAIKANEKQVWGWVWKGWALRRLDRWDEAEAALRQAIQADPQNAQAHASLGAVLGQKGQRAEAIAEYERAVALAPANVGFRLNLANIYRADGQIERAKAAYLQVLQLDPENESAKQALQEIGD